MGCHKLQVSFYKRATNSMALLQKETNEDTASYASSPPCSDAVGRVVLLCIYHDSLIYVTYVTRLTHTCDTTPTFIWHHSAAVLWRELSSCVYNTTPSYTWHDSLTYVTRLTHTCEMTQQRRCAAECVFVCMTWLPHLCNTTLLYYMWHDCLMHATSLSSDAVRQSVFLFLCIWHDSVTYVTCFHYIRDTTLLHMWHDSLINVTPLSSNAVRQSVFLCVWHDSLIYVTCLSYMTCLSYICDTTPSYM